MLSAREAIISIRVLLCVVTILVAAGPAAADCSDDVYVYLASFPRTCNLDRFGASETVHVYVDSGSLSDVSGVAFRLVPNGYFTPGDVQSITTPPGVTIVNGDVFTGITLLFSSRHLDHDPVLNIELSGHLGYGDVETRSIYLIRGAGVEPVPPFMTIGYPFDCLGSWVRWYPPAEVEVPVGQDASFCFRAVIETSSYPPAGFVQIVDPLGWVPDSFLQDVNSGCGVGLCGWNYTAVTVPVHVPDGTANGTTNAVTVRVLHFGTAIEEATVLLRAANPLAVETATWGRIKALYR